MHHPPPIPFLPDSAPFSTEQRAWLNGYLAGVFSLLVGSGSAARPLSPTLPTVPTSLRSSAVSETSAVAQATKVEAITIVFGSQSGNCETIAKRAAKALKQTGHALKVIDAAQFKLSTLATTSVLLLVTSTYGEGEPPDNIAAFYTELHARDARLDHVRYAVLALGDRNYTHFCKTGQDFDARLAALGATRLRAVVTCDVDYEADYAAWLRDVTAQLSPSLGARVSSIATEPPVAHDAGHPDRYSKTQPYAAAVLRNVNLNGAASTKQTRHVEFSLAGSGLAYEAGDALGVLGRNCPAMVEEILRLTGFNADTPVPLPNGASGPLREALSCHYDITKLTPAHVALFATRTRDETLTQLLQPDNAPGLKAYLYGRELIDLIGPHPRVFGDASDLVGHLRKLQPRLYSIASSQKAHPQHVHLTVGVVRYEAHGRSRTGVCSGDLARVETGQARPVFVHPNSHFKLPACGDTDIIMVGPGTGIAPFRAFLQERVATGARGRNWLFFGCRTMRDDFLYCDELEAYRDSGVLGRLDVAFSRAGHEKVYVQHLLQRRACEVWDWLQAGAHFYVCGDAAHMARDVDVALHTVAEQAGGLSHDAAAQCVSDLRANKRYVRDVY